VIQSGGHYGFGYAIMPNRKGEKEEVPMRAVIISFLLFMVPSVFGQSVADAARKNRPKDAKITSKRVWTDDDVIQETI
jgi:hypothetical protein